MAVAPCRPDGREALEHEALRQRTPERGRFGGVSGARRRKPAGVLGACAAWTTASRHSPQV
eukprot:13085444-Alexandrium_andersonii.AAC.1